MPRIRTIKPELWQDEDLSEVSEPALLLAIGLLNHADDEGYFKAHPGLIKATVFPLRDPSVNIPGMLTELSNTGYIRLFEGSDSKQYGRIVNFLKHQRINRPTPSKIRGLDRLNEGSVSNHGEVTPGREQGRRNGEEEQEQEQEQETGGSEENENAPARKSPPTQPTQTQTDPRTAEDAFPEDFEVLWSMRPKRSGSDPKLQAFQQYKKRLKEGHSAEIMQDGVGRYYEYVRAKGDLDTPYTMQLKTFLGPECHFLNDWTPPAPEKVDGPPSLAGGAPGFDPLKWFGEPALGGEKEIPGERLSEEGLPPSGGNGGLSGEG